MKALSFSLICFFSILGFASDAKALQCPEPHPKYQDILRQLQLFESSLAAEPECQNLQSQLADLRVFYASNVSRFERLIRAGMNRDQTSEFNPDELDFIGDYTGKVATSVLGIISSLNNGAGACLSDKQKPSFLASIASLSKSVTGLASSYAGPFVVPIQIGGQIFASILEGIDEIMRRNRGYDFSDPDKHQTFVQSLCIYHDIRQEIVNNLNPLDRILIFSKILGGLHEKVVLVRAACEENSQDCIEYELRRLERDSVQFLYENFIENFDRSSAQEDSPWLTCSAVADLAYGLPTGIEGLSDEAPEVFSAEYIEGGSLLVSQPSLVLSASPLEQAMLSVRSAKERVKRQHFSEDGGLDAPAFSPELDAFAKIQSTYDNVMQQSIIPTQTECWTLSEGGASAANRRSLGLIDSMIKMALRLFENRLNSILYWYGSGDTDQPNDEQNYVLWLHKTYEKQAWAFEEIIRLIELSGAQPEDLNGEVLSRELIDRIRKRIRDGSDTTRHQIGLMKQNLDQRLLYNLAPQLLDWHLESAGASLGDLEDMEHLRRRKSTASIIRRRLAPAFSGRIDRDRTTADLLDSFMNSRPELSVSPSACSNVATHVSELLTEMDLIRHSLGAIDDYCHYFQRAGTMNDEIFERCEGGRRKALSSSYNSKKSDRQSYESYIAWCHSTDILDGDSAQDYEQRVQDFNNQVRDYLPDEVVKKALEEMETP